MKCKVEFCIYEYDGKCTCNKDGDNDGFVNISQNCPFYIPIYIPDEELKEYKRKNIEEYSVPCEDVELDEFLKKAFKMYFEKTADDL